MTATTIETAEPGVPISGLPRVASEIDPADVIVNAEGQCWRELLVRLPATAIYQDLNDPRIWRRVQQTRRTALVRGDRVRLVAWNEVWAAETLVSAATDVGVTLARLTRYDLEPRTETLFGDEKHTVEWVGNGFRVRRRADQQFVTGVVSTREQAERDLRNIYGRPAER